MRGLLMAVYASTLAISAALAEPHRPLPAKPAELEPRPVSYGPMTFRLIDAPKLCTGCDVIVASGEIDDTSAQDFRAFFDWHKTGGKKTYFIVDSPGGDVLAGWEIARKLRALSASVIAGRVEEHTDGSVELKSGRCISMCNALVIAGVERRLTPGTTFGIHQFSAWNATFSNLDNKVTVRDIRSQLVFAAKWLAFSREMGSDSRLVEAQFGVMSEKVDYLDPDTLALWKVTTAPSATLPKLLREAGPGLTGQLPVLGEVLSKKMATATPKPPTATTGLVPVSMPARQLTAVTKNGDRQWSEMTTEGSVRQSIVESQADFARVTFACSAHSAPHIQINLRGIPEERQKLIVQQIINGNIGFAGRPLDIAQTTLGFGSSFYIKFSLMPDQLNAFVALRGQIALMPANATPDLVQKIAVNFPTGGFEAMIQKARRDCDSGN